jgi:hypothetical protein
MYRWKREISIISGLSLTSDVVIDSIDRWETRKLGQRSNITLILHNIILLDDLYLKVASARAEFGKRKCQI